MKNIFLNSYVEYLNGVRKPLSTQGNNKKHLAKTLFFILFMMVALAPVKLSAQDSYTVNSLGDLGAWDDPDTWEDESIDGFCSDSTGFCTLRAATEEANNRGNSAIIHFGLNGTIVTGGDLYLTDGSQVIGPNGNITINSGGDALVGGDNLTITGLIISAENYAMRLGSNLTITGNNILSAGVGISAGEFCIISDNIIHASGEGIGAGNENTITGNQILSGQVGITVIDNNVIGGVSAAERNIIGGCILGVALGGSDNKVIGNYIGVDESGNAPLPNIAGIIIASSGNIIGGSTSAERNIISGNTSQGIGVAGTNNVIKGNYIGLGADGVTKVPNGIGIKMDGAGLIGGDSPGDRNIISGNGIGVSLGEDPDGNSAVILKGNFIGTDPSGTQPKGNSGAGVTITSAGHRIEKNIISANGTTGIGVLSVIGLSLSTDNVITDNKIGTDVSGLNPLPNAVGIIFQGPSNNNIVGEGLLAPYEGNIIAFNTGPGILVDAQQSFGGIPKRNTFRKNSIFRNGDLGIKIQPLTQEGILAPLIDSLKNNILYGHGANPDARIDVYESDPDPSGAGEGKTWIASGTAIGAGTFEISVSNTNCNQLTITQTDLNRNTSQFSQNLNLDPVVKSLVPGCPQIFLVGVSLINPFTATLDWKGVPEGDRSVTFTLNGEVHQGILSGDIATTTYNMSIVSPGNNIMTIKATSCGGASPDFTYNVCGTAVPEWAAPAGSIIATGVSCDAIYNKVILFPDPALVPDMPFITDIPFIGGALGFLSTQGKVSLRASTAGGTLTNTDVTLNTDFNIAGEKFDLTVSGTTNTTLECESLRLDGSLTATVSVSHTYSWGTDLSSLLPVTCPSIPILGEMCESARAIAGLASLGAEVGGSIGITANYTAGSGVEFTSGSGSGSIFIRPFINIFPFSAQGRGTLSVQVDIPSFNTHGQVTLQFSASAGPFGSRDFGPYHWPGKGSENLFNEGAKYPSFEPSLKLDIPDAIYPENVKGEDTLIVSGIPSDGAPAVAVGPNGRRAVVWSHFSATGARPSGDIGIKIYDGATWGSTIFLNTDIQVDQNPTAAFDDAGHIVVCWERNLTTTIPAVNDIWVADYLQGFNIQYAILDANSGTVQNTGTFGNANTYDFKPGLSGGIDGSVLLVWESTNGNTIYGNSTNPATLHSARWNGSAWGSSAAISSTLAGLHSWESANRSNDTSIVTLVLDTDNNFSTSADWEVYASLWNGTIWSSLVRLTDDAIVDWGVHATYTDDGRSAIAWLKNSSVVGVVGDVTQQPEVWLDETNNIGLEFMNGKIAEGGGKMVLAWPEVGNISFSGADLTSPVWTPRATRNIEGDERSLSLAMDKDGQGIFGYLHVPYSGTSPFLSDTADIYITPVKIGTVITDVKEETAETINKTILLDAYPNPFDHSTKFRFQLEQSSSVTLKIFDIQGHEVITLVNEKRPAGYYEEIFDAANLSSGTYFYRLQTNTTIETKKLILMK